MVNDFFFLIYATQPHFIKKRYATTFAKNAK